MHLLIENIDALTCDLLADLALSFQSLHTWQGCWCVIYFFPPSFALKLNSIEINYQHHVEKQPVQHKLLEICMYEKSEHYHPGHSSTNPTENASLLH